MSEAWMLLLAAGLDPARAAAYWLCGGVASARAGGNGIAAHAWPNRVPERRGAHRVTTVERGTVQLHPPHPAHGDWPRTRASLLLAQIASEAGL